jgi:hypothetical protein
MDFRNPFRTVTPTLDGDVLRVLAGTHGALTGREVSRIAGLSSHEGARKVLERLVGEGVVSREQVGRAFRYRLNRAHVAAPAIELLANLRAVFVERLRAVIGQWPVSPTVAVMFGSVARGEADADSDVDILVVRPRTCDTDDPGWRQQLLDLQTDATTWAGNDTRVLEYGQEEVETLRTAEHVLAEAASEGIELGGDLDGFRRMIKTTRVSP